MSRDRYKDSHITMSQKLLLQKPPNPFHPRCFDAPKPWRPLEEIEEWKRRRKVLSTSEDKADVVIGEENGANETQSRERRHLLTFKAAGMGGKFGPSCSPRAPLKARQACAEQRALKRCSEESKVTKKKIDQLDYLEEGRKLRQKLADEIVKIETIKSNKIN